MKTANQKTRALLLVLTLAGLWVYSYLAVGGDLEPLEKAFSYGDDPAEFVSGWGQKYDLEEVGGG